jgi:hypothetical protein
MKSFGSQDGKLGDGLLSEGTFLLVATLPLRELKMGCKRTGALTF